MIKTIGREKTVILSSHILAEVEATCDRILIINKGKIVADGTAGELRKQAKGHEVLRLTIEEGDKNTVFEKLSNLNTVESVEPMDDQGRFEIQSLANESSRRSVYQLCVDNSWVLTEMTPVETKLEDIFHELTMK